MPNRFPFLAALALLAPAASSAQTPPASPARPNIVLVVLDDVGVDKIAAYGLRPSGVHGPCTPSMDALAAEGLLFLQAWGDPVSSPTRAQILTGRHGFRTGIGASLEDDGALSGLSAKLEVTLPEILSGYDSALVGKWHLAPATAEGLRHPIECGFHHYAGTLLDLSTPPIPCGPDCTPPECPEPRGYTHWVKTTASADQPRASQTVVTTYATTVTTDDAIAHATAMRAPWFLEVAFNAAHGPATQPPKELTPPSKNCAGNMKELNRGDVTNAMVEALDTELGRLIVALRKLDPTVVILLVGDNGSSGAGAQGMPGRCFARARSQGTLFQGGVRIPLIVAGPKIAPGRCDALVSATDVYATLAELAGVPSAAPDSISLVPYLAGDMTPRRSTVYAEMFTPNFVSPDVKGQPPFAPASHQRTLRNASFKLIRTTDSKGEKESFFDLRADPCETSDLLFLVPELHDATKLTAKLNEEQLANLTALRAELAKMGVYQ